MCRIPTASHEQGCLLETRARCGFWSLEIPFFSAPRVHYFPWFLTTCPELLSQGGGSALRVERRSLRFPFLPIPLSTLHSPPFLTHLLWNPSLNLTILEKLTLLLSFPRNLLPHPHPLLSFSSLLASGPALDPLVFEYQETKNMDFPLQCCAKCKV